MAREPALEAALRVAFSGDAKGAPLLSSFSTRGSLNGNTGSSRGQHRKRFYKTRLCPYHFKKGSSCKGGDHCSYAHSFQELRPSVDLTKTKLCHDFVHGYCARGASACPFAHGTDELRSVRTTVEGGSIKGMENLKNSGSSMASCSQESRNQGEILSASLSSTTANTRNYLQQSDAASNERALVKCATFSEAWDGPRANLMLMSEEGPRDVTRDLTKSCYAVAEHAHMMRRRMSGSEMDYRPAPSTPRGSGAGWANGYRETTTRDVCGGESRGTSATRAATTAPAISRDPMQNSGVDFWARDGRGSARESGRPGKDGGGSKAEGRERESLRETDGLARSEYSISGLWALESNAAALGADPNLVLEVTVSQLWTIMIMAHVADSPLHVVKDVVNCLTRSAKSHDTAGVSAQPRVAAQHEQSSALNPTQLAGPNATPRHHETAPVGQHQSPGEHASAGSHSTGGSSGKDRLTGEQTRGSHATGGHSFGSDPTGSLGSRHLNDFLPGVSSHGPQAVARAGGATHFSGSHLPGLHVGVVETRPAAPGGLHFCDPCGPHVRCDGCAGVSAVHTPKRHQASSNGVSGGCVSGGCVSGGFVSGGVSGVSGGYLRPGLTSQESMEVNLSSGDERSGGALLAKDLLAEDGLCPGRGGGGVLGKISSKPQPREKDTQEPSPREGDRTEAAAITEPHGRPWETAREAARETAGEAAKETAANRARETAVGAGRRATEEASLGVQRDALIRFHTPPTHPHTPPTGEASSGTHTAGPGDSLVGAPPHATLTSGPWGAASLGAPPGHHRPGFPPGAPAVATAATATASFATTATLATAASSARAASMPGNRAEDIFKDDQKPGATNTPATETPAGNQPQTPAGNQPETPAGNQPARETMAEKENCEPSASSTRQDFEDGEPILYDALDTHDDPSQIRHLTHPDLRHSETQILERQTHHQIYLGQMPTQNSPIGLQEHSRPTISTFTEPACAPASRTLSGRGSLSAPGDALTEHKKDTDSIDFPDSNESVRRSATSDCTEISFSEVSPSQTYLLTNPDGIGSEPVDFQPPSVSPLASAHPITSRTTPDPGISACSLDHNNSQ